MRAQFQPWQLCQSVKKITVLLVLTAPLSTFADERLMALTQMQPLYRQECASCHMAYPPGLLPAPAWQKMMGNLQQHFGNDASLDAPSTQAITQWLVKNAGTYKYAQRDNSASDRITTSAWWQREHRKISAATYQRPSIQSAANCIACHTGAEQGNFDDDFVQIPK